MHKIITKWIEPYVLLEKIKQNSKLTKVLTFNGFSKNSVKKEFLKALETQNTFGLYMKNVNIFYLFEGEIDIDSLFGFSANDYELTDDTEKPFEMVDLGKAEAGILKYFNN